MATDPRNADVPAGVGMGRESRLDFYRRWHRLAKPYFEWQFRQFQPYLGKRVADVGCGLGNFAPFLRERELYLGVDPDRELTGELLKQHAGLGNVEVLNASIEQLECAPHFMKRGIDSILCVNVIEHIENDQAAIRNMVTALPRGGHLCLLVPALPWLYGTLDTADGHYRRYSKAGLVAQLQREPLEVLASYYFNSIGAFGWFVKGRVLKEKQHADANFTGMNLLVPLLSRAESVWHPPFGLSLIVIGRKK